MQTKTLGLIIFILGIFTLLVYTAFSFIWALSGINMPYPLSKNTESFGLFMLLTPPLGTALMVFGGLIYGYKNRKKEITK